jgi:hypothetical protein
MNFLEDSKFDVFGNLHALYPCKDLRLIYEHFACSLI